MKSLLVVLLSFSLWLSSSYAQIADPRIEDNKEEPPAGGKSVEPSRGDDRVDAPAAERLAEPEPAVLVVPEPLPKPYRGALRREPTLGAKRLSLGAPHEPSTCERLLWVPRVLFLPVHLTSEYLVRTPLKFVVEGLEKWNVLPWYTYITSWDDGNLTITPVVALDLGFAGSYGIGFVWNHPIWDWQDFSARVSTNFGAVLNLRASTRMRLPRDISLTAAFNIQRRDDFVFYGQNSPTFSENQSRFHRDKVWGALTVSSSPAKLLSGIIETEVSSNDFGCPGRGRTNSICGADQTANTADDLFDLNAPGGATLFSGYDLFRTKARVVLDTRHEPPDWGTGVRLEAFGRYGKGVGDRSSEVEFARYGGELSAHWDIVPTYQRVLSAKVRTEFTENLGGSPIPFSELITAGGSRLMKGFLFARFQGHSLAVASVDYRYPIWSFLDADLFYEVGNTFDANLNGFSAGRLRQSFGLGLRSAQTRNAGFTFLIGAGTKSFNDGGGVEMIRFAFGTNTGF